MKFPKRFAMGAVAVLLLAGCSTPPAGEPEAATGPVADYRNSRAEVVVLNFFDMYCPHCQAEAGKVNELHRMVQGQGLASRVEFFGIGWANSPMESEMYRKRFKVPYKIVPDRDKAISSRFGKFRPPLVVALRRKNGNWTEFYRIGRIRGDLEEVHARIIAPVRQ